VAKFKYLGTTLTDKITCTNKLRAGQIRGMLATIRFRVFCPPAYCPGKRLNKIYKTIILPVVLYRCETWSLTLREEHRLRVFENRVLRRIFGCKRDEVMGEWRKLHSGELHNLYLSPDIIRQIKSRSMGWAGHVARMGEGRNLYRVLVGRPEGKRPLERSRRRWEDGIKMDLREIGWEGGVEWIHLAQHRDRWRAVVNAVMNLRVLAPQSSCIMCLMKRSAISCQIELSDL
jgi:hypothetical protein